MALRALVFAVLFAAVAAQTCDVSSWPDKDHDIVCGECKVLVDNMDSTWLTCDNYCRGLGKACVGAWEDKEDTCEVYDSLLAPIGCSDPIGAISSDAICECSLFGHAVGSGSGVTSTPAPFETAENPGPELAAVCAEFGTEDTCVSYPGNGACTGPRCQCTWTHTGCSYEFAVDFSTTAAACEKNYQYPGYPKGREYYFEKEMDAFECATAAANVGAVAWSMANYDLVLGSPGYCYYYFTSFDPTDSDHLHDDDDALDGDFYAICDLQTEHSPNVVDGWSEDAIAEFGPTTSCPSETGPIAVEQGYDSPDYNGTCVFPFVRDNVVFHGCADVRGYYGHGWCSFDQHYVGNYGLCSESCPGFRNPNHPYSVAPTDLFDEKHYDCPSGAQTTCCDGDGSCTDGDDDYCCYGDDDDDYYFYCSTDSIAYAIDKGGIYCPRTDCSVNEVSEITYDGAARTEYSEYWEDGEAGYCHFPFTYRNRTFHSCTNAEDYDGYNGDFATYEGPPWCSHVPEFIDGVTNAPGRGQGWGYCKAVMGCAVNFDKSINEVVNRVLKTGGRKESRALKKGLKDALKRVKHWRKEGTWHDGKRSARKEAKSWMVVHESLGAIDELVYNVLENGHRKETRPLKKSLKAALKRVKRWRKGTCEERFHLSDEEGNFCCDRHDNCQEAFAPGVCCDPNDPWANDYESSHGGKMARHN